MSERDEIIGWLESGENVETLRGRGEAFDLFLDFGNFLKTVYEANLSFKGDLKEVLNFIDGMMNSVETNCNFEEREGFALAYAVLEAWEKDLEIKNTRKLKKGNTEETKE